MRDLHQLGHHPVGFGMGDGLRLRLPRHRVPRGVIAAVRAGQGGASPSRRASRLGRRRGA
ncbi:hypothetical protein [Reyranella sp.]|uniref:hypothetical protein n=1 Tax=Reyranella sp. TaxID=1929291 RepID=UPI003D11A8A7